LGLTRPSFNFASRPNGTSSGLEGRMSKGGYIAAGSRIQPGSREVLCDVSAQKFDNLENVKRTVHRGPRRAGEKEKMHTWTYDGGRIS
jgi:hypothetical protein